MSNDFRWSDWQQEHSAALQTLQEAQRAYHRSVSASAFAGDDPSGDAAKQEALRIMDTARVRLDAVRARRPV